MLGADAQCTSRSYQAKDEMHGEDFQKVLDEVIGKEDFDDGIGRGTVRERSF